MRAYVGQKQLPAFFKLAGGWTTKEHEIRTGLTAGTLAFSGENPATA